VLEGRDDVILDPVLEGGVLEGGVLEGRDDVILDPVLEDDESVFGEMSCAPICSKKYIGIIISPIVRINSADI
jgi:hypothetical protein